MFTMGQFQDVKWPPEYTELTRIEELLHCRICYEYIDTSVVTPCSHNYCSICIRKFLHYKSQCPVCFENIYEKDLYANRILDEFKACYLILREKLFPRIEGAEVDQGGEKPKFLTPVKQNTPTARTSHDSEARRKLFAKPTGLTVLSPEKINFKEACSRIDALAKTPVRSVTTPGTSGNTPRINALFLNKSEEKVGADRSNGKRVPCPVCGIEILETKINRHLDDCLKRQRSMSPPKNAKNSLPQMPKYVLNLMKDAQLRKTLKTYGLSTSGGRKVLEKRIQKFSTLYNVERDKLVPKTVEEIVRQCEAEENAEKNIPKQNSADNMLNIDRKTDVGIIEKAQKQYLERHKEDYQKLIESINGRNNAVRSLFGESTSSTSQATTSQSIFNENESNSSGFDLGQGFLHDSDSTNTSYPLQHYSRDDPMKFLTLQISTDSQDSPIKLGNSSSTNHTPIRSSIESRASVRTKNSSDGIASSSTKISGGSSSTNETPMRFSIESKASTRSENSSDRIASLPIKMESGNEPENLSDRIASSNPSASNTSFSYDSKDSTPVGKDVGMNASVKDIFDASTEDNLSDSCSKSSTANRSKKFVMKRSKLDLASESTDSETDVELNRVRPVGRKPKIQKHRMRKGAKDDGSLCAESRAEEPTVGCGGLPGSSGELNKENSGVKLTPVDDDDGTTQTRRSSRKRTRVFSYAMNSAKGSSRVLEKSKNAGKKVLDEQTANVIVDIDYGEDDLGGLTKADSERDDDNGRTEKRSLRKRSKR